MALYFYQQTGLQNYKKPYFYHVGKKNPITLYRMLLFVAGLLIYGKCIHYGFVWDDLQTHLLGNKALYFQDIKAIWFNSYEGMYIPLSYQSWLWLCKLAKVSEAPGIAPAVFHMANIFVHLLNVQLLFSIFLSLEFAIIPSLIGAAFFMLHPLQVESVAWISEWRGLLCTLFLLLSFIQYQKYTRLPYLKIHLPAMILLAYLAMLCKPIAVVYAPLIILISIAQNKWKNTNFLAAVFLILIPSLLLMYVTKNEQPLLYQDKYLGIAGRLALAIESLGFYLVKLLLPIKLAASYGFIPQLWNTSKYLMYLIPFILGVMVLSFSSLKAYRFYFILAATALLPVLGLITFNFQKFSNTADRYMYLPIIFFAAALAKSLTDIKSKLYKYAWEAALLVLAILSFAQLPMWTNEFTLWDISNTRYPGQAIPSNNIGTQLYKQHKFGEALQAYNLCISQMPQYPDAYINRGNVLAVMNKPDLAIQDFNKAIILNNENPLPYYGRGLTLLFQGEILKAKSDFDKAEKLGYQLDPQIKNLLIRKLQLLENGNLPK